MKAVTASSPIASQTLTEAQASQYLGVAQATLRQGRCDGRRENRMPPPPFVRLGRKILYIKDDLDLWLKTFRVEL